MPYVVFETLKLYIIVRPSRRDRPVVAVIVLCPSVRPVVRPVVVRPLSVLCPSVHVRPVVVGLPRVGF